LRIGSHPFLHFGRKLPDIGSYQKEHHRFIALLHGDQLRDLRVSASACSPPSRFSHLFPEHFQLAFPLAAVTEEMFPNLGHHPACATAPPALVQVYVTKLFYVHALWFMSRFQSVDPGCQRLHTVHCDGSLASHFAFQLMAMMLIAFVGLPLGHGCHLCF